MTLGEFSLAVSELILDCPMSAYLFIFVTLFAVAIICHIFDIFRNG